MNDYNVFTKNNVYHYDDSEKRFKCVIVRLSDSWEELSDKNIRIRNPVITNPSSLDSSTSNDMEVESGVATAKLFRKNKKQSELKSKKQKTEEIIQVYKENRKSNNQQVKVSNVHKLDDGLEDEQSGLNLFNDYDNIQNHFDPSADTGDYDNIPNHFDPSADTGDYDNIQNHFDPPADTGDSSDGLISPRNKRPIKSRQIISETDTDDDMFDERQPEHIEPIVIIEDKRSEARGAEFNNDKKKAPLSRSSQQNFSRSRPILTDVTNLSPNPMMRRLIEDNRQKEEEISKLKLEAQQLRLQAASDGQKLQQLRQQVQQLQEQQQRQQQQQQQHQQQQPQPQQRSHQQQRYDPYYYLDHDMFDVGDNTTIPSTKARAAFNAETPAKFVSIMSHAMWNIETLSQRVVRRQKNTRGREELTPRKKELLKIHYRYYLEQQNYPKGEFNREVNDVTLNKYLDRAIQSAKRLFKENN
ncbi:putative uncharacterized protein DDB_G0271606 isoform X2 [Microplitis mediator]|uniref:putative uncharacterized protein DDB_G0271606 isoform X2 n=1 Tax=Microplitis mediator TaxID=375433 RepID=UPI0025546390|nr:putative uncharacterized protein DDB_G0271606 isoform X2 [Microplitis mediator]XP_057334577.1 putative uncharacterized protein DDB_G0271606 isoform X2 [Microplitis mediator]